MPNFTLSASFPSLHQAAYEHEWSGGECMVRLSCLPAARCAAGSISIIIRERHQMLVPPPPATCQLPREPEPIPQSVFFVTLNLYSSSSTSCLMSYADIKLAVSTATRRAAAFLEHKILKFLNQKISLFAAEEGRSSTYAVNAIAEVVYTYNNKEEEEFHELMMTSARENEEVRKMVEKMTAEMKMKMKMMKLKVGEIIRDNLGSSGSSSMSRLEEEEEEEEEEACAICLNAVERQEKMRIRCEHFFHYGCIVEWLLLSKNSCPLCRAPLAVEF